MNPFGDDDEDFETSEILNYNLDVSYRTVLLDESTYPEKLMAATFEVHAMKGVENDNLKDFIKETQDEMEKIDNTPDTNELVNLEIKHKWCQCFSTVNPIKKAHEEYEQFQRQFVVSSNNVNRFSKPTDV